MSGKFSRPDAKAQSILLNGRRGIMSLTDATAEKALADCGSWF